MSNHKSIKISGLIQSGRINPQAPTGSLPSFDSLATIANPDESQKNSSASTTNQSAQDNGLVVDNGKFADIPVNLIEDSPYQPRIYYDPTKIDELAHTLASAGQKERIQVRQMANGRYELIAGHRRTRAARTLGWVTIQAIVLRLSDEDAEKSTMVHNEASEGLTDYEHARLYEKSKERGFTKTQEDIAKMFGTNQASVSRCLSMLRLPAEVLRMLDAKEDLITGRTAQVILQLLKDHPDESALVLQGVQRISDGATQDSLKGWVEQMVKARNSLPHNPDKITITDKAGRTMFTTQKKGNEISVKIKASELDSVEVAQRIADALRGYVHMERD
ncbi:ParB/RepB/Spo0J family partition protein [Undibacterium sp. SXout7W]|uniref:ParB/RepB/Spo0J family partition protein n=1 Tax=Undibacterium sp. SXout7W TaxID=3413049 RepID=UPI003BF408F9